MKTNHLLASAAFVLLVLLIVLFARQSSLSDEIALLRAALQNRPAGSREIIVHNNTSTASDDSDSRDRVGRAEPFLPGDDDPVTDARRRLLDLEATLHGQADILEKLLAENAKLTEQRRKASMRSWGPEQAAGEPDTNAAGDRPTAWAPAVADGGTEWLQAEFENPADLAKIVVRQTCNPGGITKVVAVTDSGTEIPIWTGEDPGKGKDMDDTPFNVPGGINAKRVKVYIDTSKVAGWEEIDAMQIVGRDGSSQWAKSTSASSTYASGRGGLALEGGDVETSSSLRFYDSTTRDFLKHK